MDVSRCSNNCFLCLRPWNKKPRPKCSGALACCVTVHVCLQPCMMVHKQSSALALCTTAAERGLFPHLSPPTLYFLCPTYSSFRLLHLLLLFLMTKNFSCFYSWRAFSTQVPNSKHRGHIFFTCS